MKEITPDGGSETNPVEPHPKIVTPNPVQAPIPRPRACTPNSKLQTLSPKPSSPNPTPYTLNHIPYTLHPTPQPPRSKPRTFFTLVTGPRRSLSLKLSDTKVYAPQIRARLGNHNTTILEPHTRYSRTGQVPSGNLSKTSNHLSITSNNLSKTSNDLSKTSHDLSTTSNNLSITSK